MESSSAGWEVTIKNIGFVVGLYYLSTRYLVYHRKKVMRYQASSTKAVHSAQITYDIIILTYWLNNTHCLTVLSQETTVHSVSAVLLQETQQYCHTSECVTLQEVQCHFLLPVQSIVTYSYSRLIQGTHQRVICHEQVTFMQQWWEYTLNMSVICMYTIP